jgi:hypothetical protein
MSQDSTNTPSAKTGFDRMAEWWERLFIMVFRMAATPLVALVAVMTLVINRLPDVFLLTPWGKEGNPLYTQTVRGYTILLRVYLVAIAAFETYTWSASFGYALASAAAVWLLTGVMVTATLVVDRSLLVMNTRARDTLLTPPPTKQPIVELWWHQGWNKVRAFFRLTPIPFQGERHSVWTQTVREYLRDPRFRRQAWMRFAIVLAISVVNAVPFELRVFEPEINDLVQATEIRRLSSLRETATATTRVRHDELMRDEQAQERASITRFNNDRIQARQDMVTRHDTELARLRGEANRLGAAATNESAGRGPSGQRGAGGTYEALRRDASEASDRVRAYEATAHSEQTSFDRETATRRSEIENQARTRRSTLNQELETRLAHVRSPAFAQERRVEWEQPRGFLARFSALRALEHQDASVRVTVWGLRCFTVFLGLMFLLLKARAPREFETYHSVECQAAAGHEGAKEHLRRLGVANFSAHARDISAKGLLLQWHTLCVDTMQKVNALETEMRELAIKREKGNWALDANTIRGTLRKAFLDGVAPMFQGLSELENAAKTSGLEALLWPDTLNNGIDPRFATERLWNVSSAQLTELGWEDPTNDRAEMRDLCESYIGLQFVIAKAVADWNVELHRLSVDASAEVIDASAASFYAQHMLPALMQMTRIEQLLTARAQPIPAWPNNQDPREGLEARMLRLPTEPLSDDDLEAYPVTQAAPKSASPVMTKPKAAPPPLPTPSQAKVATPPALRVIRDAAE